jgi:hypothetical protein
VDSNEVNIFYLDNDPRVCAEMHNDKHCIKMILEYAQLLSTAHRILDGTQSIGLSTAGRKQTRYVLPDGRESVLYSATHVNHPSAVWVRHSVYNYMWLTKLLKELCAEYTYRYGKVHKCERDGLVDLLHDCVPDNISLSNIFTEPTPAMPDEVKIPGDSVASYHNYYISNKQHLASWKGKVNSRNIPEWFNARL